METIEKQLRGRVIELEAENKKLQRSYYKIRQRYDGLRTKLREGETIDRKMLRPWAYATYRQLNDEIVARVWNELAEGISARQVAINLGMNVQNVHAIKRGRSFYAERMEMIKEGVETLGTKEKRMLELRYGLNGGGQHSLKDIGIVLSCTRQYVQQIIQKAITKLRMRLRKEGTMKLGEPFSVPLATRGVEYLDGGYSVSNVTREGSAALVEGIGYVCPHGIACPSMWDREKYCKECDADTEVDWKQE